MNIDIGTLAYLQKENTQLKDEIERLQKQLDFVVNGLNKCLDKLDRNHDSKCRRIYIKQKEKK